MIKINYTYESLKKDSKKLFEKIQADNYKIDYILGVSVGGLPLAVYLSKLLNSKNLVTISISSYNDNKKQKKLKLINKPCKEFLENKNILVVDDISDTGDTFKFIINLLKKEYSVKNIKTASLFVNKDHCKLLPNYLVSKTNKWIEFPWE